MEKIVFDAGVKSYKAGGGVLRFNPCDPAVYERFLAAAEALEALTPKDAKEADCAIREQLEKVFPGTDWAAVFPGNLLALCGNGQPVIANFLEALEPVLVAGARKYAKQ